MSQFTTFPINYNTPPIKIANYFTGTNIGEKINAAINSFNGGYGEVWVFSEAAVNTIGISIELKSGITLKFHSGFYRLATACKIWMWNNSVLTGSGWDAIIQEPLVPWTEKDIGGSVANLRFVWTNGSRQTPNANNGSHPSYNLAVHNLQFLGNRDNPHTQDVASVTLGNCHNGVIRNCWFNETSGYACGFGNTSGHSPGLDTDEQRKFIAYTQKEYGNNLRFENNLVEGVPTQNVAVFSCQNFSITGNKFVRASKRPYTIASAVYNGNGTATLTTVDKHSYYRYGGVNRVIFLVGLKGAGWSSLNGYRQEAPISWDDVGRQTLTITVPVGTYGPYEANSGGFVSAHELGAVIDLEPNGGYYSERVSRFNISNNVFDLTETARFVAGIGCQAPPNMDFLGGVISGNVIIGPNTTAGNPFTGGLITDGIYVGINPGWVNYGSARGVTVNNNVIENTGGPGISLERIAGNIISNNTLIDTGWNSGSGRCIMLADVRDTVIQNNTIRNPSRGTDGLEFVGPCSGNTLSNNIIGDASSQSSAGIYSRAGVATNALTNNRFWNNILMGKPNSGGIIEGANDANNIYDGNLTYPNTNDAAGNQVTGIKLRVGGGSKIISHHFTDGKVLIPNMSAT